MDRTSLLSSRRSTGQARGDWLRGGVLAGLLGTFAMTIALLIAYGFARGVGVENGNVLQRWCWALVHNPVAERASDRVVLAVGANLAVGLLLALAYARVFEPMLSGPGWKRGMQFSLLPWILSLLVFLPLMGGGFLGFAIGAGPLPILGNLILHFVYGAVLGAAYAEPAVDWLDDTAADRANADAAERGAAIGVAIRLPPGFIVGWIVAPSISSLAGQPETAIGVAFIGAALGIAVGSFAGMGRSHPPSPGPPVSH